MLKRMHARAVHSANRGDVPRIGSDEVLAVLRATQAERARHAEEVAEARRQKELWRGLAKVTTARAPRRHRPEGDPHPMTAYPVTTPDAVERQYQDSDGNPCDLVTLCRREPGWAANRIDTLLAER